MNLPVYYQIYAKDGVIPLKTPVLGNPFLGCIRARSIAPPHTAQVVKRCIAKVENIKDCAGTSLFLTACSQSPMGDTGMVTGSTPQEPLALIVKISDSERSALESGGRGGLASAQAVEPDSKPRYRMSIQHSPSIFS